MLVSVSHGKKQCNSATVSYKTYKHMWKKYVITNFFIAAEIFTESGVPSETDYKSFHCFWFFKLIIKNIGKTYCILIDFTQESDFWKKYKWLNKELYTVSKRSQELDFILHTLS